MYHLRTEVPEARDLRNRKIIMLRQRIYFSVSFYVNYNLYDYPITLIVAHKILFYKEQNLIHAYLSDCEDYINFNVCIDGYKT